MPRKSFFREPTAAQIAKRKPVKTEGNPVADIFALFEDEYLLLEESPLPRRYRRDPNKFLKHGEEVRLKRFRSIKEATRLAKIPLELRIEAYNSAQDQKPPRVPHCCYSVVPIIVRDKRRRKYPLRECFEAARLFAYSAKGPKSARIKVKPYDKARRVAEEGAEVVVSVPSRERGALRYKFKLLAVPVADNPRKFALANSVISDHRCGLKRFRIRYPYKEDKESTYVFNWDAHDLAALIATMQFYWEEEHNIIPLQMSQVSLPSQLAVGFYKRLLDSVLIHDETLRSKLKLRKLNIAEKEEILDHFVYDYGADDVLVCRTSLDGRLTDYDWSLRL